MDIQKNENKIVCLGGGVGTANLLRGLRTHFEHITAVVSMADDGGSAGRLRRFYNMQPPGDIINCMLALSDAEPTMKELLRYRFAGNRYGSDSSLPGHKLGNLLFVALKDIAGSFENAILEMQRIFAINGTIYPSTTANVSLWAETSLGEKVAGEQNIDLGKFKGKIQRLHIVPVDPPVADEVLADIENADIIIGGPGDLYTTILPVLLIPKILKAVKKSKAKKFFIVNVANKKNETPDYTIADFINALKKHCGEVLFDHFILNTNTDAIIPKEHLRQYSFVPQVTGDEALSVTLIKKDILDKVFPLYHDSEKLAKVISQSL